MESSRVATNQARWHVSKKQMKISCGSSDSVDVSSREVQIRKRKSKLPSLLRRKMNLLGMPAGFKMERQSNRLCGVYKECSFRWISDKMRHRREWFVGRVYCDKLSCLWGIVDTIEISATQFMQSINWAVLKINLWKLRIHFNFNKNNARHMWVCSVSWTLFIDSFSPVDHLSRLQIQGKKTVKEEISQRLYWTV